MTLAAAGPAEAPAGPVGSERDATTRRVAAGPGDGPADDAPAAVRRPEGGRPGDRDGGPAGAPAGTGAPDASSGPWWRRLQAWRRPDRRTALTWGLALAATVITLSLSAWHRSRCVRVLWDGTQYRRYCYNDIQVLYFHRGLDRGEVPYLEALNEYPVLTGVFQYLAARVGSDLEGYLLVTAIGLGLCALAVTVLLLREGVRPARLAVWAIGPPLFLYAFHNWDLLAVLAATAGLLAFRHGRPGWAGIALGLGAAAKLYPLFLLPPLGAALVHAHGLRAPPAWRMAAGAAGAWLAVSLPVLLAAPQGFLDTYRFHAGRDATWESPWRLLRDWTPLGDSALGPISLLLLGGGVAALTVAAWTGRLRGEHAALGALVVVLLASRVFSVQYMLWLLPFAALLPVPWTLVAALWAADAAVFLTVFRFFRLFGTPEAQAAEQHLAWATLARAAVLAALLAWAVLHGRHTPPTHSSSVQYQRTASPGTSENTPADTDGEKNPLPRHTP